MGWDFRRTFDEKIDPCLENDFKTKLTWKRSKYFRTLSGCIIFYINFCCRLLKNSYIFSIRYLLTLWARTEKEKKVDLGTNKLYYFLPKLKTLKRPLSPFCAYFLLITKFVILDSTVIILNQLSQWQLHISKWCLLNWINIPARVAQITSFVMRTRNVQTGLDSLFKENFKKYKQKEKILLIWN